LTTPQYAIQTTLHVRTRVRQPAYDSKATGSHNERAVYTPHFPDPVRAAAALRASSPLSKMPKTVGPLPDIRVPKAPFRSRRFFSS